MRVPVRTTAVQIDLVFLEQMSHEAEAVGVQTTGANADENVAVLDALRAPELVPLCKTDGEPGHVEVAVRELPGVLGGLAAEEDTLRLKAAFVHAGDDLGDLLRHDLSDHQVVEEEQGDRTAGGDVVDAHRHEVDPDGAQPAHGAGELDLGAYAVRTRYKHRILEPGQSHGAAEPAEAAEDERVLARS